MKTDEKGRPLTYWGGLDESKKQTAVEWFADRIKHGVIGIEKFEELEEQAKAMEKEQIKDAWDNGCGYVQENSQQYYNETFKQK
jgi:hypothetical protein